MWAMNSRSTKSSCLVRVAVRPRPAAPLRPILAEGAGLDVAGVGQGHGHVLRGHEILPVEAPERGLDGGPARVGREPGPDVDELLADHRKEAVGVFQDLHEVLDSFNEILVFVDDLVLLEPGQAIEAHVEDGLGLGHGQAIEVLRRIGPRGGRLDSEALLVLGPGQGGAVLEQGDDHSGLPEPGGQPFARLRRARRSADERDHLVDVRQGHREPLQHVRPRPRAA